MGKLAIKSMLAITAMAWLAQPATADTDSVDDESQDTVEFIKAVDTEAYKDDSALAQAMQAALKHWEKGGNGGTR